MRMDLQKQGCGLQNQGCVILKYAYLWVNVLESHLYKPRTTMGLEMSPEEHLL